MDFTTIEARFHTMTISWRLALQVGAYIHKHDH